jgi:hypothetical protein
MAQKKPTPSRLRANRKQRERASVASCTRLRVGHIQRLRQTRESPSPTTKFAQSESAWADPSRGFHLA